MVVNELKSRRFAGDFTNLAQFYLESDRSPSPIPNYDKDLPRIPSTSTELCGDEVVTVFTNLSGDLTTSPVVGFSPFRGPSHVKGGRGPMTEAQKIAAQYRQRRSRSSESPSSSKRSTLDGQAMNAAIGASTAPPIRRGPVDETETTHQDVSLLGLIHEDGTVSCIWDDCSNVLPNLHAFLRHLHVHLIHEGLNTCELCGTRFTDDRHKDGHLNSCQKLPNFDKIGSLEDELFGPLNNFLGLFNSK